MPHTAAMTLLRLLATTPLDVEISMFRAKVRLLMPEMRAALTAPVADGALTVLHARISKDPTYDAAIQDPRTWTLAEEGVDFTPAGFAPGPRYAEMTRASQYMAAMRLLCTHDMVEQQRICGPWPPVSADPR